MRHSSGVGVGREGLRADDLEDHLQLVLSDRSPRTREQEHGVASTSSWRLADLGAKHAMLRSGLGWGSMPRHIVAEDIERRRLVELRVDRWVGTGSLPRLEMVLVRRPDHMLGPAGRWLFERLAETGTFDGSP